MTAPHGTGGGAARETGEPDRAFPFATAGGDGSRPAVLPDADADASADASADIGRIGYGTTLPVKRVGAHLDTVPRHGAG